MNDEEYEGAHAVQKPPFLSNRSYDVLKYIALILLPALGSLYFALAGIWGLPYAEQVIGSIVAVDTALGLLLRLSSTSYDNSETKYDGAIEVQQGEDDSKMFSLVLHSDPDGLVNKDQVIFRVDKN